jgi:hypothetical protein
MSALKVWARTAPSVWVRSAVARGALTISTSRTMFSGSNTCQPLGHTVGDEGEVAEDGDGAQEAHVLGDEGEQNQR